MSKNISVKINNGNETIETVKLNAASKKVIIKAQPNVNYELVDEATQYAPEMIDTKRVGNDLHIAFEGTDINKESDLVLEGYYEHDNTELLLGMAEDGQYYAYVPQSGMESDAVTLLADQVFAPQALGGNSVAAPFWAFNPNWLWVAAGVAAVGGIIAAASGSSGSGSSNKATDKPSDNTDKNNNSSNNDNTAKDTTAPAKPSIVTKHDGSVEITPPADADTKSVEVSYTDEAGTPKTATLTKGEDGTWTSNNPDVAIDPATGKATIPADKVQDGSPVKAKATDTAGNTGEEDTANAGNNPDTTAPAQPTVTAKDNGSVEVTPPADADTKSVDVSYTDEAGTPKTATLTKGTDGTWTSDNPDVAVDPITGKSTIPADKVQDGSPVKAKATDTAGNPSEEGTVNAGNNPATPDTTAPATPTVEAKDNGSVEITPPADADTKSVEVSYTDEAGTPKTATITKGEDGTWTSNNPDVAVDPATGKATIPADKVQDGSPVKAKATDTAGNPSEEGTVNAGNNPATPDTTAPATPTVEAKDNGSVEITPPADADTKSVEVSYTDEAGTPKTATITKGEDGTWTSNNPDVALDPATGKATIPADKVQDGSPVKAKATDTAGNPSEEGTANAGNNPDTTAPNAPEVTSSTTDGSVTVQVPSNAKTGDIVEVTITPDTESGNATPITVTLTKQADGSWTSDNESAVPNVKAGENSSIIPEDKVEDLSKVTVVTKDAMGNVSNKVETIAPLDPAKLSVNEEGKVVVTLPKQVNEGDLIYLNTIGGDLSHYNGAIGIEFHKTATGWDIASESREEERDITKVDEYTYILNNLKPTSRVTAQHIEKDSVENFPNNAENSSLDNETGSFFYTISDRTKGSVVSSLIVPADNVPPGKPTISSNADGSVNITPPTDKDVKTIEVNYIDENGNPQNAVLTRVVLDGDYHYGGWTSNNPDVKVDKNGEATISADKVKDGSLVTAKATDESGNTGDEAVDHVKTPSAEDTTAPSAPEVTPSTTDGSVTVKVPSDAQTGDTVEVTVTPEGSDTPEKVTLTKQADGSWTSDKPETVPSVEAGKDSTTIPEDKVKDGSEVTAQAKDPAGNESTPVKANAGNNAATPDTTAPSAPEVTPSTTDGSVTVKVPSDAQTGDTVEVTVTPEGSDTPEKVTLTKNADGSWTSDKPETVPSVEAGKDSTTIPQDKVKDGSEVTAQAKDPSGNESTPAKANAGNNAATPDTTAPSAPEVTPSTTDGSVTVKVPSDAQTGDTVEVTVTPEGSDTPEKVTLTKNADGSWTSDKPETVPSVEAGKDSTTIPQDKVKDGSEVTAQAKDPSGNESTPAKANAGNNAATPDTTAPSAPEVTPSTTDGSVTVKVPSDAEAGDTVEVTVTPEGSDTPEKVTLTKQADGSWTSDKPAIVPNVDAGKDSTTIPEDKVKDGSEVSAKAKDPAGNESAESKGNAGNNADHTAPSAPEVTPSTTDGSVTVKVPGDAEAGDTVEVTVTPEGSDTPEKVTLTKQADGSWTSDKPAIVPNVEAGKDSTTIPEDKVKDGSEVSAKAKDPAGNESAESKGNAGNNADHTAPSAPEVTPSTTDGSVTVKVPSDAQTGDTVEVTVPPEGSDTPEKVTLTKNADGSWTSDKPAIVPSIEAGKDSTTIPEDKVKDGSEVSAKAKDPAGNESTTTTVTAGNDKPSAPTVTASTEDGSVTVAVPDDAKEGDVLNIAVEGENDNAPTTVSLTKQSDGSWTSSNPNIVPNIEVGKNSTTIPQDNVKDGSDINAMISRGNVISDQVTAQAGSDKVVTPPTLTANDDGSVVVNVPADAAANDTVEVTVTPESITGNATPVTVVLTKQADGSWTSSNEAVVPNVKAGETNTTIDNNSVEDLSKVSAITKTPTGLESEKTEVQALLDPPALEAATDSGDVIIELPADADIGDAVAVYFTQPNGTKYVSMVQKQADGTWADEEGVFNISNNKATISGSNIQDNTEVSVQHVYKTATDEIGAEYNDDGSAKPITDLTKASKLVSIISGEDKVVKLELSLAQDTGESNTDNYTNNRQVNVSGIPLDSEWEYSTDGGQNWTSGSGGSFILPNNTKVGGIAYSLQARVKGNAASTSDTLNMTLDQKAGEFHAIIDGSMNLIGTAEKNSTISINNRSGKADANGEFEFATGIASGATAKKVHYTVVETDLAGNSVSKDVAYTYYRRYAGGTKDTYGNENDVILIGTKGGTGDLGALIKSSLTTGDGDDSVYATGVQYGSNTLDMGDGNDFASFKNIGGTINMGAGNDILEGRNTDNPFFYLSQHARVDMGTGDDIVRTANTLNTRASIDGGDGFDTLQFINNDGKAFSSTLTMISNFEKIDIKGTLNNSVTISASDVEKNHSATATVDASGKSHNNVLIVDGDAGDKVTLSGISKAASSQVTYEGNTYNVYNTGSNELWVDSDITVA